MIEWTQDADGDWYLNDTDWPDPDACVCPHHTDRVKIAWDFGRWYTYKPTVEEAKAWIEEWWSKHPKGVHHTRGDQT